MATKSANILARVEPEVKEQAEEILSKLGIPVSVGELQTLCKLKN